MSHLNTYRVTMPGGTRHVVAARSHAQAVHAARLIEDAAARRAASLDLNARTQAQARVHALDA